MQLTLKAQWERFFPMIEKYQEMRVSEKSKLRFQSERVATESL